MMSDNWPSQVSAAGCDKVMIGTPHPASPAFWRWKVTGRLQRYPQFTHLSAILWGAAFKFSRPLATVGVINVNDQQGYDAVLL